MSKRNEIASVFCILFCVLLTLTSLLITSIGCAGASIGGDSKIYVPDNYLKIQDAINNAVAGDTIIVRAGTYTENVDVNKAINLIGEGRDLVTVTAKDTSDHVFDVTARYVNITGFRVVGATGDKAGIYLNRLDHSNIYTNDVSNNNYGIFLYHSDNNILSDNFISGNSFSGIHLYSSDSNSIINNAASDNFCNIFIQSSKNNNITDNTASDGDYGIYMSFSANNKLTGNTANSNARYGIDLVGSSVNNTITDNNVSDGEHGGIAIGYSSNYNTITHNIVNSNRGYCGILLYDSSNYNTITNNIVNSNDGYGGIFLWSSSNNNFIGNTMSLNNGSYGGIFLYSNSDNNVLMENNISNNTNGIYISNSGSNVVTGNSASGNSLTGIRISSLSNYNTIMDNTVNSNTQQGIYIYSSSNNTLTNNTIAGNGHGMGIEQSGGNVIYNNYFNNMDNIYFSGTVYENHWNIFKTIGINIVGGPYLGGNFWANPDGTGFSEVCDDTDKDGFCDGQHKSDDGKNIDFMPLSDECDHFPVYPISLFAGWNPISTPLEPENSGILQVLDNLTGRVIVTTYDTGSDEWYVYDSNSPESASLLEFVAGRGYFLYSELEQNLVITGNLAKGGVRLYPGWNLAGYNSLNSYTIGSVLCGIYDSIVLFTYDTKLNDWTVYNSCGSSYFNTLAEMTPGRGYWIWI